MTETQHTSWTTRKNGMYHQIQLHPKRQPNALDDLANRRKSILPTYPYQRILSGGQHLWCEQLLLKNSAAHQLFARGSTRTSPRSLPCPHQSRLRKSIKSQFSPCAQYLTSRSPSAEALKIYKTCVKRIPCYPTPKWSNYSTNSSLMAKRPTTPPPRTKADLHHLRWRLRRLPRRWSSSHRSANPRFGVPRRSRKGPITALRI